MNNIIKWVIALCLVLYGGMNVTAQEVKVMSDNENFMVASEEVGTLIYVDESDHPAVLRATGDLELDIKRVCTTTTSVIHSLEGVNGQSVIIAGTLGRSELISQLIEAGKIDMSYIQQIQGKWEASIRVTVDHPTPEIEEAIVIVGSDRRGTIYGIYDLSELIGVSPWFWWADVTPTQKTTIMVPKEVFVREEPDVKYRGIFINDEWNLKEWSKSLDPDDNMGPETYKKIFELMLRLKANFLKPAMHPYSDNFTTGQPDVLNMRNADAYGIVVGSAQPLFRTNESEWNDFANNYRAKTGYKPGFDYSINKNKEPIRQYWRERIEQVADFELAWSLGMRGLGDGHIIASNCHNDAQRAVLLQEIIEDQQNLLREIVLKDPQGDISQVFQTFEVYKEVLQIYNAGLKNTLPEEIAIIWSEDNHGHIRQLPDSEEQQRSGGNTLYYHLSYWGSPKSYLWLYTTPLSLVSEEMDKAYANNIKKAWIFNVGDIKPGELALEYVVNKAWDVDGWNGSKTRDFVEEWIEGLFGEEYRVELADILMEYHQLSISRRPEFLVKGLFNQEDFGDEWTKRLSAYEDLYNRVNMVYEDPTFDESKRDALYQLVVYPVRGTYYFNKKFYYQDKYELYRQQGRGESVNIAALLANQAQSQEENETAYYNTVMMDGKWNKMMDPYPSRIPKAPRIPKLSEISVTAESGLGVINEGQKSVTNAVPLKFSSITRDYRFIDIFNKGTGTLSWQASTSHEWIKLTATEGSFRGDQRVWAYIDWSLVPEGNMDGVITINAPGYTHTIDVQVDNAETTPRENLVGFVEANGYVSIQAEHFDRKINRGGNQWKTYEGLGRDGDAVIGYPADITPLLSNIKNASPELQYDIHFKSSGNFPLTLYRIPTLDKDGVRVAIAIDDGNPIVINGTHTTSGDGGSNNSWAKSVLEGIEKITKTINVPSAGNHTLKMWMVDPSVAIDKIVIDTAGLDETYFAPPESYHGTFNSEPGQQPVDVSKSYLLEYLIDEAGAYTNVVNIGTELGQFGQNEHTALIAAYENAQLVIGNQGSTTSEIEIAMNQLLDALIKFKGSRVMEDENYTYLVYENVEQRQSANDVNDLHLILAGSGSVKMKTSDGNKTLDVNTGSNEAAITWSVAPLRDTFTMEYNVKVKSSKWLNIPYIYEGDQAAISVAFKYGENLTLRDGGSWRDVKSIELNTWYNVKLIVNPVDNTYDCYLDGEKVAEDFGFRDPVSAIERFYLGANVTNGLFEIDDIKVYKDKQQSRIVFEDNMEQRDVGDTPNDLNVDTTWSATAKVRSRNNALRINSKNGKSLVSWPFEAESGKIKISLKAMVNSDKWALLPYVYNGEVNAVSIALSEGNKIKARDGNTWRDVSAFTKGQWYDFTILLNTSSQKYDFYIDGALIARDYGFRESTSVINMITIGSTEDDSDIWMDDLKVVIE